MKLVRLSFYGLNLDLMIEWMPSIHSTSEGKEQHCTLTFVGGTTREVYGRDAEVLLAWLNEHAHEFYNRSVPPH